MITDYQLSADYLHSAWSTELRSKRMSKLHPLPLAQDAGKDIGSKDEGVVRDSHADIETKEENHIGDAQNANGDVADK